MTLTKADIDALVDGMCPVTDAEVVIAGKRLFSNDVRRALRLAAGLSATGERKPERVRCWMYGDISGKCLTMVEPSFWESRRKFTPGWFVPDGAE